MRIPPPSRRPVGAYAPALLAVGLATLLVGLGADRAAAQSIDGARAPGFAPPNPDGDALASPLLQPCDGYDAGTLTPGAAAAASADLTLDTIFLCRGDEIAIDHNGDQRLDGDPEPATRAGVGYAWYACRPTVDGPTLGAVAADACLLDNPAAATDPTLLPFALSTQGRRDGDQRFVNDGAVQAAFAAGDPAVVWFAPITFDSLDGADALYENGGSCVSVGVDAAFAVAYLNDLTATGLSVAGCEGSFTVDGGLPELRAGARYAVEVVDLADASVRGTVLNPDAGAGDRLRFRVPRAGTYRVSVSDGKSCTTADLTADLTACTPPPAVALKLDTLVAAPAATVCVPLRASGFADVASFDFAVDYDEVLLRLDNVGGVAVAPTVADDGDRVRLAASGGGAAFPTLPDGAVLLELCFEVLGLDGEFGLAEVADPLEGATFTSGGGERLGVEADAGGVAITDDDVAVFAAQHSAGGCPGADDNGLAVTLYGGVGPYTVRYGLVGGTLTPAVFLDPSAPRTFSNLAPGDYRVEVTDALGDVGENVVTLRDGPALGVRLDRLTDLRCAGDAIAVLRATATLDGVDVANPGPGYAFAWADGATGAVNARLGAGAHGLTVTDDRGCSAAASETLADPPALALAPVVTDASCRGVADGTVELAATGGTPRPLGAGDAYDYALAYPDGGVDDRTAPATTFLVEPGTYAAVAVDANGCRAEAPGIVVAASRVVAIDVAVDSISCFGAADGELVAVPFAVAGVANDDYQFTWFRDGALDNAAAVNTPRRSTNAPLAPGVYVVEARDADGCTARDTHALADPPLLTLALVDRADESCVPGDDGAAEVRAAGGRTWTQPYAYSWTDDAGAPVASAARATGLTAGGYDAVVADESGCTAALAAPVTIAEPAPPRIVSFADDALLCHGYTDGVLRVEAEATTFPLDRIEWADVRGAPGLGTIQRGLTEGAYAIAVVDSAGCVARDTAEVTAPDPLALAAGLTHPACFEQGDGAIALTVTGGTPPYLYTWSNGVGGVGANAIGGPDVTEGTYAVTVNDANFCPPIDTSFFLDDPAGINPTERNQVSASCASGVCDGALTVSAELPGSPGATFTFAWESGETVAGATELTATRLCGGRQVLSIRETSGTCPPQEFAYDIPAPPPLSPQVDLVEPARCFGERSGRIEMDTTYGGTPAFTYAWTYGAGETSVGRTVGDLPAGEVALLTTDAAGCTQHDTFAIAEPPELVVGLDSAATSEPTCAGFDDGVVALSVRGGNASAVGFRFRWNDEPARDLPTARAVRAGRYVASATDVKGCIDTLVYTLAEPTAVQFALDPVDTLDCFGDLATLTFDTLFGGRAAATADYLVSVGGGTYAPLDRAGYPVGGGVPLTVSVIDTAGCEAREELVVATPPAITVRLPEELEVELGDSIRLRPSIFAGGAPIRYDALTWTNDTTLSFRRGDLADPFASPVEETVYELTVVDEAGCSETAQVRVTVDRNRNVFIPNAFSPNNDAVNDEFEILTGPGVARVNYLQVFDRYGERVYSDDDVALNEFGAKPGWDGNFRGRRVPVGTYAYIAEVVFLDGRVIVFQGDVNVLY